jgi:alkanesulfonate monooxygenase SsuD/methylene tetrahydromethanopterin reductase-like flavin-dependent oxidoreductase (luciferase family)
MSQPINHGGRGRRSGPEIFPKPERRIPILIGGFADAAVTRAGVIGDGYVASSAPAVEVGTRFRTAWEAAQTQGREFRLAVMLDVALDGTKGAIEGYQYKQEVYRRWKADEDIPAGWTPSTGGPDDLLIRGSSDEVARRIADYVAAAPTTDVTLIVRLHFPGMSAAQSAVAVERFGRDVMPHVRQMAS